MTDRPELRLHEEVLLLALKDEKGTPHASQYGFAMGGALLAELLLTDRLILEDKPRRKPLKPGKKPDYLVALGDRRPMSDPILDECLHRVGESKRPRSPQDWVMRFARLKDLRRRVAVGLCRRGILREEEDRIMVMVRRTAYPTLDGAPESRVVDRLRKSIMSDSEETDARTAVLVALANVTGLLKPALGKDILKQRKARIKVIAEGDVVGDATRTAVEAAQAAVIAATTAVSAAAISAGS